MDYRIKYLKYKNKYLNLKGGASTDVVVEQISEPKLLEITDSSISDMVKYGFEYTEDKQELLTEAADFDAKKVAEGGGTYNDSVLLILGFFYDKILPNNLKTNVLLNRKHIYAPYYEIDLRGAEAKYREKVEKFHNDLNEFIYLCKNKPEKTDCFSSVIPTIPVVKLFISLLRCLCVLHTSL